MSRENIGDYNYNAEQYGSEPTPEQWKSVKNLCEHTGKPLPKEGITRAEMKQYIAALGKYISRIDKPKRGE
ncbi:MAG: hypothetical protein PHW75_02220 [Patescibacteria group bacterium]|nr:hypothetical protein [Patescibacteria group bacterium]